MNTTAIARAAELATNGAIATEEAKVKRTEAAGIVKRTSAFTADPRAIGRKEGFNPRHDFGEIEELAKSIKANGLLQPLRVKRITPVGEKHFELIDGDRRLTAIETLMKKGETFPDGVMIILADKAQDDMTSLFQMFEANTGKPFTPIEEAAAYKRMKEAGLTIKQICEKVGRKQVHVVAVLALIEADDSVKDAVKSGAIGKTLAKSIAVNARGDKAKQAELTKQAIAAGKDKGKQSDVKKAIDDSRRAKAAKKGQKLKMRALDDMDLSKLGATVAAAVALALKNAGKPVDFDIRAWVKADDALALAATYGALEALKAAAGQKIDLVF